MVPATLVRSAGGRIIPLVDVSSRTMPPPQGQHSKWRRDDNPSSAAANASVPIQFSFTKTGSNNNAAMSPQHRRHFK